MFYTSEMWLTFGVFYRQLERGLITFPNDVNFQLKQRYVFRQRAVATIPK